MSDILTVGQIAELVREARPNVIATIDAFKEAAKKHVDAERAYKMKEASVFLEAKSNGATDEMAKRIALIESEDEKAVVDELAADKAAARLGSEMWQTLLDVYTAMSHTLNRELKWHQAS